MKNINNQITMKRFFLSLCMTIMTFVTALAQGNGSDGYKVNISPEPFYVECQQRQIDPSQPKPWVREFTVTAPAGKAYGTDYTLEARLDTKGNDLVTVSITKQETLVITLSPKSQSLLGIGSVDIVVKENGQEKTSSGGIEVNVYNKDYARYLEAPANKTIAKGQSLNIPVVVTPSTAVITPSTASPNVGLSYDNGVLTVTAPSNANEGDKYSITLSPDPNSTDRAGNTVQPVTFDVTVMKPELPVEGVVYYNVVMVGQEYPCPLHISDPALEGKYTVSFGTDPVPGYEGVITVDDNGLLIAQKVGKAKARATFTPNTAIKDQYREWSYAFDFTVIPAEYRISIQATEGSEANTWNVTPSVSVVPATTLNFEKLAEKDYNITYSLEGEIPGTAEVDQDGKVTVTDTKATQSFYVIATLTPKNDQLNYSGAVTKTLVKVNGTVTGAYLQKQTDGSWVAYLSSPEETYIYKDAAAEAAHNPDIIAKFTVLNPDGTTPETQADIDALLAEFKNAKDIKVMGNINSFNIAQLVHAMGVKSDGFTPLTEKEGVSLDFSGATMVGPFGTDGSGKYNDVPTKTSELTNYNGHNYAAGDFKHNITNVTRLVLPKPDPNHSVLPKGFNKLFTGEYDNSKCNLVSLTIPEGWTEIAGGFSSISDVWGATPYTKLTELNLPNSMQKIGEYAFSGFHVQVLTMPYNIRRIDQGAFSTSPMLQDVYFTGPAPEFVHTLAFSGVTQMCNNTVHDQQLQEVCDPDITRYEYYNGTNPRVLACLLHYPKQYQSQYIDETRVYKVLPPDVPYSKGYHLYTPEGWTPAVLADVRAKKIDWNAYVSDKVDYGVKDQFYGYDMIWPSQNQMSTGFAFAQAGYQWNGQPLRAVDQYDPSSSYEGGGIDRRGLYQFIVFMNNADFNFEFENDKWYTIALPFNMSIKQIKDVFGDDVQVCRFSKVTRITEGEKRKLRLEFRKSVMKDQTGEYDGTDYSDYVNPHPGGDLEPEYTGIQEGIIHHFPYMIRPKGVVGNQYVSRNGNKWVFNGLDFPRVSGTLHPETRYANGEKTDITYLFSPILSETKIKVNSYILVNRADKGDRHEYVFYKGKKNTTTGVYEPGGKANQNTAYVQLSAADGKSEYEEFFKKATSSEAASLVWTFYPDDEDIDDDGNTTDVEQIEIVCGDDRIDDGKLYNINGLLVNGNNLRPGIYIKNGKKFIVR